MDAYPMTLRHLFEAEERGDWPGVRGGEWLEEQRIRFLQTEYPESPPLSDDESILDESDGSVLDASPTLDADEYISIYWRKFPESGWGWRALDDEHRVWSENLHNWLHQYHNFKYYQAPVDEPRRVLDLRSYFGFWADDVAISHGSAQVLGLYDGPAPETSQENCDTQRSEDFNWSAQEGYDLIHGCDLLNTVEDVGFLIRKAASALTVDGCLDLIEMPFPFVGISGDLAIDQPWAQISDEVLGFGQLIGCSFGLARGAYIDCMEAVGLLSPGERWETIPVEQIIRPVLDRISCVLVRKYHSEGVPEDEAKAQIDEKLQVLADQADGVGVQLMTVWGTRSTTLMERYGMRDLARKAAG
ncbi:hypothetical protein NKR23_g2143 [Pleurostoma richardsiae]|uniref:Uncharacterized protein n=1 Tax=Pleurostoma richardsiae TaxID=41990 RepID=A0AA38S8W1_9PEZI|nr:hypothetical protein NKR23_g2143 [Pleurostoma richardsiae]